MHPWLYRFGFPGFAEREWVLPEGVEHEEPWYAPLPPAMAIQDLNGWGLDPELDDLLRALHEATFGEPLFEPPGVPFHALLDPLRAAFERGTLVAWAIRAHAVLSPAELPKVQPKPKPGERPSAWIEIVLVDQTGAPLAGEPFEITPSDGQRRSGTLDDRGFARVDGIASGPCDVTFPKLDGREWSANGPSQEGDLREETAPFAHRAGVNDCLSSIAARYRFRSWRTVYDNDHNGDLRALRADPNVLAEGDQVMVDRKRRVELRDTEARHRFRAVTAPTSLRLRLDRMKPQRYVLTVDGAPVPEGGTREAPRAMPKSMVIEHPIAPGAMAAELALYFDDSPEPFHLVWRLDLGALRPVERVRGVKERLNNLGFGAGREDEHADRNTERAVMAFQRSIGDTPTGTLDDGVREKVRTKHDVS